MSCTNLTKLSSFRLDAKHEALLKELDHEKILSQLIYEKSLKEKEMYLNEIKRLESEKRKNLRRSQELENKYRASIRISKENENCSSRCRSTRVPFTEINPNQPRFQDKGISPIKIIPKRSLSNHFSICVSTQTEKAASPEVEEPAFLDTAELVSQGSIITALKNSNLSIPLPLRSSSTKSSGTSTKRSGQNGISPEDGRNSSRFSNYAETSRKNPLDSLQQETDRNPMTIEEVGLETREFQSVADIESLEYSKLSEDLSP
ncbi:unnamed protein product [Blepharisma stoltei]|uniref:Uncharacterized protein n=1 Tax=Blepharisma stoltei TaxID=1481888 RepID=A0AAU9J1R9_9CILI|nr:unnamed protein product [Blepharisma stoltei]